MFGRSLVGWVLASIFATYSASTLALTAGPDDLLVRVVDTGQGLCTVTVVPGGGYMVYDAGHWTGQHCVKAVRELVPPKERVDLFIISHGDSDHLGQAAAILSERLVGTIIRTGQHRSSNSWRRMDQAMVRAVSHRAKMVNLQSSALKPGTEFKLGKATVSFVAGWPKWTASTLDLSEMRNVVSIVVRLSYRGRHVLFTGDTIGRRRGDPKNACRDAEQFMVSNANSVPIKSEVLIAPHHGGNNASSSCFINAVRPTFVIFSAGRSYAHPRRRVVERYLASGVAIANIFRTDRGDDEGDREWSHARVPGCVDLAGDDDIDIVIESTGKVEVAYRSTASRCGRKRRR